MICYELREQGHGDHELESYAEMSSHSVSELGTIADKLAEAALRIKLSEELKQP